ncbi:peroxiredoxin Q/BCP [Deinococcus metalli]|uniref:thioredoxin-dependent peroxiredoxin n=1 Tax=Deinococcus metalli TaxID=1141878 RepID=A0A7W8KBP2_9DEIO|nr:peroxiredoxin [Deinococcus metalli]MBB5375234.1 peroxiredoxin Q/BCP [Deinococcus metalli]GHF30778.1 peroxiredoxin [Deinococcus metalli]
MTSAPTTPAPGDAFPEFSLPDAHGHTHALSDLQGRYVVLYAYPKDDTPGCTKEACDFRDNALLRGHGAAIVGISADDAESHAEFAEKFSLPFPLLVDDGAAYLKSIGAYGEKNLYGKVTQGIKRQTFLIGPDGRLVRAWLAVKVDGHADAVADAIDKDRARRA